MNLADINFGGEILIGEIPAVTVIVGAVVGWAVRHWLRGHDARVAEIKTAVDTIKVKQDEHAVDLALLIAGDTEDGAEQVRTRQRLHRLENAAAFVRARLEMQGRIQPGEWDAMQRDGGQ